MGDCGVGEHGQPTGPEMQQKTRSYEPQDFGFQKANEYLFESLEQESDMSYGSLCLPGQGVAKLRAIGGYYNSPCETWW